jgi:hypothetical protein
MWSRPGACPTWVSAPADSPLSRLAKTQALVGDLGAIDRWSCVKSFGAIVIGRSMVARRPVRGWPTLSTPDSLGAPFADVYSVTTSTHCARQAGGSKVGPKNV